MDHDVIRLLRSSHGLVTVDDAYSLGMSASDVQLQVRSGRWVRVRRGVYVTRAVWDQADETRGRPLLRVLAASASMRTPHVVSHDSAALVHGLPLLEPPRHVHITRFGAHGDRTTYGVKHHKAPFEPWQVQTAAGVPLLDAARTAADLAREHGRRQGIVAFDAALAMGARPEDLHAAAGAMRSWPGVTAVRDCLDLADGGAESPGESLARLLVSELGVGRPETQFGLLVRGRQVWCDLRVRRHIIEFDGRVKYLPGERGGHAGLHPEDVLWGEKLREDDLRELRFGVSRLTWVDVTPAQWSSTQARLLSAIGQSDRLYGRSIDDLRSLVLPKSRRGSRPGHASRPL